MHFKHAYHAITMPSCGLRKEDPALIARSDKQSCSMLRKLNFYCSGLCTVIPEFDYRIFPFMGLALCILSALFLLNH